MEWIAAVIGIVTGLLGIPASLYAFRALKHDLFGKPDDPETIAARMRELVSPNVPHEDRVLLKFDPSRSQVPGTLEHAVQRFVEACPLDDDKRLLIRNPIGIFRVNRSLSIMFYSIGSYALIFLTLMLGLMITQTEAADGNRLKVWLAWLIVVCLSLALSAGAYLALRRGLQYKRGRDAAKAYMDYLLDREISIGVEFTQSRRMREREDKSNPAAG